MMKITKLYGLYAMKGKVTSVMIEHNGGHIHVDVHDLNHLLSELEKYLKDIKEMNDEEM